MRMIGLNIGWKNIGWKIGGIVLTILGILLMADFVWRFLKFVVGVILFAGGIWLLVRRR